MFICKQSMVIGVRGVIGQHVPFLVEAARGPVNGHVTAQHRQTGDSSVQAVIDN